MELTEDWSDEEMETNVFLETRSKSNLAMCSTVQDSFVAHGLAADDNIDRREQVLMFRNIETEMESELKRLMEEGQFDRAKSLGARLESLRKDFGGLQLKDEMSKQDRQRKLFGKATKIFKKQQQAKHGGMEKDVEAELRQSSRENENFMAIQRENLTLELSRMKKPRMKYSKLRMEYKTAEVRLCELKQYDDAKNVRKMLAKIDAEEEAKFDADFQQTLQNKIDLLTKFQKEAGARQEEKESHVRWKQRRLREKEASISVTNLNNKMADMNHCMDVDGKMRPELTVRPSALLKKRANYNNTTSKHRGGQLLDMVTGKSAGDSVFIESLCTIHKFNDKALLNTTKYGEKLKWKGYETDFGKTFQPAENQLQGLGPEFNQMYD